MNTISASLNIIKNYEDELCLMQPPFFRYIKKNETTKSSRKSLIAQEVQIISFLILLPFSFFSNARKISKVSKELPELLP